LRYLSKHGAWWEHIAADGATVLVYFVSVIACFSLFQLVLHLGVKSVNNAELTARIKVISFVLLTVGVFFDLLAS
jgi:hypothetical protein